MTRIHNLLDADGVADLAGVLPTTVRRYRARTIESIEKRGEIRRLDLPEPAGIFGQSPVWDLGDIARWLSRRTGGRLRPSEITGEYPGLGEPGGPDIDVLRVPIDEDCPGCGHPERVLVRAVRPDGTPGHGQFICQKCNYISQERDK